MSIGTIPYFVNEVDGERRLTFCPPQDGLLKLRCRTCGKSVSVPLEVMTRVAEIAFAEQVRMIAAICDDCSRGRLE